MQKNQKILITQVFHFILVCNMVNHYSHLISQYVYGKIISLSLFQFLCSLFTILYFIAKFQSLNTDAYITVNIS